MTLTLIIGLPELTLLHGKVITWRPVKNCSETRLNVELNDYARLVALRLNQLFDPHNIVNPFAVDTLHELCENTSPLLSQFLTYVDKILVESLILIYLLRVMNVVLKLIFHVLNHYLHF